jgi:hypothetical protein
VEKVFVQLRELDIIRSSKSENTNLAVFSQIDIQFILILMNYNQHSKAIKEIIQKIKTKPACVNLWLATSSFMGYGLYEKSLRNLAEFEKLLV